MSFSSYDLIVIGAGAAGMMAAITAARQGRHVLLLEKLSKIGTKLKATGGGRCNLTNTLPNEAFMERFGRHGRFMTTALEAFDHHALMGFFKEIGVESHAPDGYRVFPRSHNALSIITALEQEMERLNITVCCSNRVETLHHDGTGITGVTTQDDVTFHASFIIIATGGLGYPQLGAEGDGFRFAQSLGHHVTELAPAMMPLHTKERWVANCRADTIPKAILRVNLKKAKKLRATGDLIFTKQGIRGPVVLDFAREITPLLQQYDEIPLLVNLTQGMDEDALFKHLKHEGTQHPEWNLLQLVTTLLPEPLSQELCHLAGADIDQHFSRQEGPVRNQLIQLLAWTPLTVTGHDGFKMAMITRGGVSLKEIDPHTMQSKRIQGLYFCGEVMNLDGPCGGYNLQWSFASGHLAGTLSSTP